jgi:hypothetical protein
MILTKEMLKKDEASDEYLKRFNSEFPDGAKTTKENLKKMLSLDLSIAWLEKFVPIDRHYIFIEMMPDDWFIRKHTKFSSFQEPIIDALVAALGGDE